MAKIIEVAKLNRFIMVEQALSDDEHLELPKGLVTKYTDVVRRYAECSLGSKKFVFKLDCDGKRLPPFNARIDVVKNNKNREQILEIMGAWGCDNETEFTNLMSWFDYWKEPLLCDKIDFVDKNGKECALGIIELLEVSNNHLSAIYLL